jgi:hypothetical protein
MSGVMSSLASERAEHVAERLRLYDPADVPNEKVAEAVRAAATMASLMEYAWDQVQQFIDNGAEGGRAREVVAKATPAIALWLDNLRIAIRIVEQWHERVALPNSLDELRRLEKGLQKAQASAEQLLVFVNQPAPTMPRETRERVEALQDEGGHLSSAEFLARIRAHRPS